ncbi:MAG: hypothetical protein F6K10_17835, partial [Moorea sp. SIO2B7]|nr:hypothetical protein [Moorena sp. SIO2B7]
EANLANDTGIDNSDRITLDPTITGKVTDESDIASFQVSFDRNLRR